MSNTTNTNTTTISTTLKKTKDSTKEALSKNREKGEQVLQSIKLDKYAPKNLSELGHLSIKGLKQGLKATLKGAYKTPGLPREIVVQALGAGKSIVESAKELSQEVKEEMSQENSSPTEQPTYTEEELRILEAAQNILNK